MITKSKVLAVLGGPLVATLALAWLMVLLILGTLAQANIGLYQAQVKYFSSAILWLGPLPTPGGATTLALLTLGLSLKLLLRPWRLRQAGSLMAHLSVWLLLVGGAFSAFTTTEGYLRIAEGGQSNILNSYHTPELAVIDAAGSTLLRYDVGALRPGARLGVGAEQLLVEQYFPNSALRERPTPVEDGLTIGARRFLDFTAKAAEKDDERNRPTLLFTKLNTAGEATAKLVLFQGQPIPQPVAFPGHPSASLVLRPAQIALPFMVQLSHFANEYYPGTTIARHYASAVTVISPQSGSWPATIQMNAPLRYQGYTLYQASFVMPEQAGPEESILAVVQNQGYLIPYAAGILLCVGLLLHLGLRWRGLLLLGIVPLLGLSNASYATPQAALFALDVARWGTLPIQHEGRLKPLATFAALTLHMLHGSESLEGLDATQWLAELVFTPERAHQRRVFIVPSDTLRARLQLPARSPRTYTYPEVARALQPQFETIRQLAALPVSERDPLDGQLVQLAEQVQYYFLLSSSWQDAGPLRVLPPRLGEDRWLAPAETTAGASATIWASLRLAATTADAPLWQTATAAAWRTLESLPNVRPNALVAERWLRGLHPFPLATALMTLASLLLLLSWRLPVSLNQTLPRWLQRPSFKKAATLALAGGWAIASTAVALRIYILQRPPVGTLYESVLFVGLVVVGLALVLAARDPLRRMAWLGIGAGLGLLLQLLGLRYAAAGGDTLGVLTAVLDTNFWLTTHVLVITAGYALALLAGAWAHGVLVVLLRQKGVVKVTPTMQTPLTLLTLAALAFTATGTLLGGIWADQSWGRFWGWDPKENGALLLTLWLVWVLHARLSGVLNPLGLVLGVAATPMIVAVAWFGVNLLGVGLHSYGFTQGTFVWLGSFVLIETLLLAAMGFWLWRRAH